MSQHRPRDQPQPRSSLCWLCFFIKQFETGAGSSAFELVTEQQWEALLEVVPSLACSWPPFLEGFARALPQSNLPSGQELVSRLPMGTQPQLFVILPPSAFFHVATAGSGIASLSFVCISRAEMSNKDQTPQVVVLAEMSKMFNIFVLCFWVLFFFFLLSFHA